MARKGYKLESALHDSLFFFTVKELHIQQRLISVLFCVQVSGFHII